ncbi:HNH endonuclease signature motif containing protein [Mycobacterium sp. CVI_P3]|uniref:HNH endonuclease signature motif containing protein n=1 Tax=Mycobacterium pinniadriaticum TaxID=2994102 RepID=A0ABT3SLA6_9MYCO|nr:HNH endonuclease signature motif containing protein [Mycobacterium pinniadriaticum]MCX2933855.1 HNH endonuclease signature motif containing protein [Mycobacterium pinniadriaticum]MCX2940292.1 HNH endonuclease signature motif containing protein [Mycobacterium pinniadriaticum]
MSSIDAVLEALDDVVERLAAVDLDVLSPPERFVVLERLETARRRQVAVAHRVVARLEQFEGCPPVPITLADVLRISPREAKRRIRDAEQLAPRATLTGESLPPLLPETATAWQAGLLDGEHLSVIQKFFRDLPEHVGLLEVEKAERSLAEHAVNLRPDQLEKLADRLALHLNPDGKFSDEDRARKRGFLWCGGQRVDGMSVGRLIADPELRSYLDAWFAKFAAPGVCNPADESPTTAPSDEVAERDLRSHGQRQHDALTALVRGQLGDPKLGKHNGLPVTVIVSATLQELQNKTGHAVTAGGTLLPIPDVIRMATHAYHFLALFDGVNGQPLWLGRTKRIATADQRIMLHNKDRGCTRPGCDAPGFRCEVHHVDEWVDGGLTNIDKLTLACPSDHKLLDQGWKTRKLANGDTEWIPPPQLPLASGTNDFHHPERLLGTEGDDAA